MLSIVASFMVGEHLSHFSDIHALQNVKIGPLLRAESVSYVSIVHLPAGSACGAVMEAGVKKQNAGRPLRKPAFDAR